MHKMTPQSGKYFPRKMWRETARRAKNDEGLWQDGMKTLYREAAYDLIRRQNGKPLWSFTGKVTDELISVLLNLYARLRPKLELQGVQTNEALWLLVENVFVPTVYAKLAQECRRGLGNEFLGEICWYLPIKSRGRIEKPLPRVLDYWMRVAGFQTTYQIAKASGQISLRRKIDRWLNDGIFPDPKILQRLAKKFAARTSWLDEPDTWKARLMMACAMQNVCDLMDEYFKPVKKDSSLVMVKMFKRISKECIGCDDNKILAADHNFFAARLVQLRWRKNGKRKPNLPEQGNSVLDKIRNMAIADGFIKHGKSSVENDIMLDEYLFELGVRELNQRLCSRRKKGRRALARRP